MGDRERKERKSTGERGDIERNSEISRESERDSDIAS